MHTFRPLQFLLAGAALLCACAAQAQQPKTVSPPSQQGVVSDSPAPAVKPMVIRPLGKKPKHKASAPKAASKK